MVEAPPRVSVDAPWMLNKQWASGRIRCKAVTAIVLAWIMAVLSNGLIWTIMILLWRDPNERDAVKVVALFGVIGLGLFFLAIRLTWGWFRHGSSVLELASIPGVIGGTVEGVIHTRLRRFPTKPVQITLTCNREYRHKAPRRSGETDHFDTAVLWQADRSVSVSQLTHGPHGVSFSLRIQIPYGLPVSDNSGVDEKIVWKVAASCDVPGIDFGTEFDVPVFVTTKSNPEWTEEKVDAMIEQEEQAGSSPEAARAMVVETPVAIKPTKHGGMEYIFRPKLGIKVAILMPVYGILIMVGSGLLYLWLGEMGPFAFLPGIIGVLFLFATVVAWTYKSRVVIEDGLITIRKSAFGIPLSWRIPFSEIRDVRVRHEVVEGVKGKKRDWDIDIYRTGQTSVKIGASIRERSEAERLAREILRFTR